MNHKDIFLLFGTMFHFDETKRKAWFPNGKDSIRITYYNGMELVFTFHDDRHWKLETVAEHYNRKWRTGNDVSR